QQMCQTRSPRVAPDFLEGVEQPRSRARTLLWRNTGQRIETHWIGDIRNIEIDQVLLPVFRNAPGDPLDKIPMQIEKSDAFAALDILADHRFEQRRFAGAGLPDDVHSRA